MKSVKRIIATMLSLATAFSVSTYAFAEALQTKRNYYAYESKLEDYAGNELSEIGPDSEIYLSVYFYIMANKTEPVELTADSGNKASYSVTIPSGFLANEDEYDGASAKVIDTTKYGDDVVISDNRTSAGSFQITHNMDKFAQTGPTIKSDEPVYRIKLKVNPTASGKYTIAVNSGSIKNIKTPKVTLKTTASTININKPATKEAEVVKDYSEESGKVLKYVSSIANGADATQHIEISKTTSDGTETQVTEKTLAQLLGGVATGGKITAKISLGVLTADTDAVFSFELK